MVQGGAAAARFWVAREVVGWSRSGGGVTWGEEEGVMWVI